MMNREEMYEYYNAVRKSLKPVRDAHLVTYSSSYLGKYYSFYMPRFYAPEVFGYDDGKIMLEGSEVMSVNGKGIDSVWDKAKELVVSSNESAVCAGALGLLTEAPEPNTPFVIELRDPETKTVKIDTLYATSDKPGRRLPDNQQVVRVIDDVLVVDPTVSKECYEQFRPYLDSMNKYRAVIFDIRGYPAFDFENVLQHIIDVPVKTEFFYTPRSCFPNRQHIHYEYSPESLVPAAPHIDIPVYFLANYKTMSWGETVMMLVKDFKLGTIIGSNTCGTNGDATQLDPASFIFRMTAIKAVNKDGSRHHGIGVIPDIYMENIDIESLVKTIN